MASYRSKFLRPLGYTSIEKHNEGIFSDRQKDDIEYFHELYKNCFQHHVEPDPPSSGELLSITNDESKKRIVQNDAITAYFIKKIYNPADISYTESSDKLEQLKSGTSYEDFRKTITGSPISDEFEKTGNPGSNRLNFLIGNIGAGKSLLATKIVFDTKKQKDDKGRILVPVYIDFEKFLPKKDEEFSEIGANFFSDLYEHTIVQLKKQGHSEYIGGSEETSLPIFERIRSLAIKLLNKTPQVRLVYIFDNIDRYHFFYSKYVFFDEYRNAQHERLTSNIDRLITALSNNQQIGDCAFCVLIACRKSLLKGFSPRSNILFNANLNLKDLGVFQLSTVDEISVLRSRFKLLDKAIDLYKTDQPAKWELYSELSTKIFNAFQNSLDQKTNKFSTLKNISKLAHHGPRSLVDFIGSIKIDPRDPFKTDERLFEHSHNLILIYITNLKKRFAQANDHFPNIFLVDGVISPSTKFAEIAHKKHRHTYWLKYLILKYISNNTSSRRPLITEKELHEFFVESGAYEPHIFKLALGSLNTSNSFQCIEIEEPADGPTIRFSLTTRGKTITNLCDDDNFEFCFSFSYLQFVIDDYQMSYPKFIIDEIYVDTDLGYLFSPENVHNAGLRDYIKRKGIATLTFLKILESSALSEKKNKFKKIDTANLFPDFESLYTGTLDTLQKILTHVPAKEELVKDFEKHLGKLKSDNRFDDFFEIYAEDDQPLVEIS